MPEINLHKAELNNNDKGFTLVELIVVMLIVVIMATMMVPSLTGYIDKAKDEVVVAECRACVHTSQVLLSENYGRNPDDPKIDTVKAVALAEAGGRIVGEVDVNESTVAHLAYKSSDGISVVYCAAAGGDGCGNSEEYTIDGKMVGWASGLVYNPGDPIPNGQFTQVFKDIGWEVPPTNIDSTSPGGKELGGYTQLVNDSFTKLGIDMDAYNIKSWSLQKESGTAIMWWSDQDISAYSPGEYVRVIRYNAGRNTYTAGYMRIEQKIADGVRYNTLKGGTGGTDWYEYKAGETDKQTDETKKSYEATINYFNEMPPLKE